MSRRGRSARVLALVAIAQLLALSLWFSASAVGPSLREAWGLDPGQESLLTLAVQVGFVVGALLSALLNLADVIPSRRLFAVSAVVGSIANLGLLFGGSASVGLGVGLRFVTGIALAGVYPAGVKVVAGWFREGRGMALGVLVGALTVGSALPHLIRGTGLTWEGVIVTSSALAVLAAGLMLRVGDGPYEVASQPFRWDQVGTVVANREFRLSTYGYLGHMWELYAMWTWVLAFVAASAPGVGVEGLAIATFAIIAIGGPASWFAGRLADREGREKVAGGAMAISGGCALLTPLAFGAPVWMVLPLMLVWGATVVADSAQFTALVTETSADETRGTAVTLQLAVGFLLTLATIRGVPWLATQTGWRWAMAPLALGPALGVVAMTRLAQARSRRDVADNP